MTYTITADQLASVRAARLQLLDSPHENDHAAAKALDWVLTAEPSGWKPIETAPKAAGGLVDILLDGRRYASCHYDRICDEYRHITACGVLIRLKGASHWMPLPHPPEA